MEVATAQAIQLIKWGIYIWGAKTIIGIIIKELKK